MEKEQTEPLRMNAYYYGFTPTGVELIDRVLSAVAHAGKGYHHTEGWTEPKNDYGPFRGGDYVSWIQNAATDAAQALTNAQAERDTLKAALQDLCDAIPDETVKADPPLGVWLNLARAALAACVPPQETEK